MSYNLGYDLTPTSNFQSERHIFNFDKMMVNIPSKRTSYPQTKKKLKETSNTNRLETTSITPLDVVTLDNNNVLFISTLDSNWTRSHHIKTSVTMKRQTSHTPERTTNYYHHPRRYSQPESDPNTPSYYQDKRNSFHNRRTSVQSDAASSTELIRRFSSESTTSSVVTHLSFATTSLIEETNTKHSQSDTSNNAQTTSDKEHQENVASSTNTTNTQTCDTRCFTTPPVWADPVKIKENPVRYEYTASYLTKHDVPPESMLPLLKPCVFYFSDSNTGGVKSYGSMIKTLFECDTAWNFSARWRLFNKEAKRVSQLSTNQNLYCFIKGVEPMWEDKVNQDGGRLTIHSQTIEDMFEWLLFSLVGGSLYSQGAVGVVVSRRTRGDRIELWLDSNASQATLSDLKNTLCSLLPESCHSAIHESRFKKHF